jgi:hypothetical protein
VMAGRETVGLRAFARARGSEEDEVQRHGGWGYGGPACDPGLRDTGSRHGRTRHAIESKPAVWIRQLNCSYFSN